MGQKQVDLPPTNGFDVLHPRQTQTICIAQISGRQGIRGTSRDTL
jgi:hypothetical protein